MHIPELHTDPQLQGSLHIKNYLSINYIMPQSK